jgi:DNA-binding IclR family transcriptional regulator
LTALERDPVGRAMLVLRSMVEGAQPSWGVRELAQELQLPPSSVHRLLGIMERNRLVSREPATGAYVLDLEFLRLADRAAAKLPLPGAAADHLRTLVDAVDESAAIALYSPRRRLMVFHTVITAGKPLRYVIEPNTWIPVTAGASGLAILAFLPDAVRSELLAGELAAHTASTITNRYQLERELETIRSAGYAISRGQRMVGAVALAAPIFDRDGHVIGDTALTIPEVRWHDDHERPLAEAVIGCSQAITRDLARAA